MTGKTIFSLCVLAITLHAGTIYAQDKQILVNTRIVSARTVCLVPAREAKREIEKWGKFKIVTDPDAADLVFKFSREEHDAGYKTTGSIGSGMILTKSVPIVKGSVQLRVLDAKTNEVLWDSTRPGGSRAVGRLVKELRRQVETAERHAK
jgi:hypothetical protein